MLFPANLPWADFPDLFFPRCSNDFTGLQHTSLTLKGNTEIY